MYLVIKMTLASPLVEKFNYSNYQLLNALGNKFDLAIKYAKVKLGPSFKQTW